MKKLGLFLLLLFSVFSIGLKTVYAEEGGVVEETPVVVEKVYTYEDESAVVTLTLKNDMTYKIVAVEPNSLQEMVLNGNYKVNEDGYFELYMGETYFDTIYLDELTMTFDFVEEYEEEIVPPCVVTIKDSQYGELICDTWVGEVGDVVIITAKPYAFCKVVEVKVNGVILSPQEDGTYQFSLVEGENILTASFEISEKDMAILAENINNYKKGNWEDIFEIENMFNLISWFLTGIYTISLMFVLRKNKMIKAQTGDEISVSVNQNVKEGVEKLVKNTFEPMVNTISDMVLNVVGMIENMEVCMNSLNRCMILAQENTPESRLAILNELTIIKQETKELKEEAKNIITSQVLEEKKHLDEKKNAIEELEQKNDDIMKNFEKENNIKGRI